MVFQGLLPLSPGGLLGSESQVEEHRLGFGSRHVSRKWAVCDLSPALTSGFYAIIAWPFTSSHDLRFLATLLHISSGATAAWLS